MSELEDPLFPERNWVDPAARARAEATILAGDARPEVVGAVRALEHWVRGGTFHRYSVSAYDRLVAEYGTPEEAVRRLHAVPPRLRFECDLAYGGRGLRWIVSYQRCGFPDERGFSSGPSTLEDAAYGALSMIEAHEREVYEQTTMVGLA